ncbi:MAG TPA: alpha/beta fold hydrolase [Acidimicrobiia bacterium]|nr:alpha/beta fold hydrolase [Acidimicrobiia bacterium]
MSLRLHGTEPANLVALHGFTQHGAAFEELASCLGISVLAPDLPGHGSTDAQPATFAVAVDVVVAVLESRPSKASLVGYSQGGRVALGVALARPDLIEKLVLISTSPGIEDPAVRAARRAADDALAGRIEEIGLAAFVDEWLALDMFAGLGRRPAGWRAHDRELRLENTAAGLAGALRGMGQGAQPYLGAQLVRLSTPALFIAGGEDRRYVEYAEQMHGLAPHGVLRVVPGAGHAVVGEAPGVLADLIGAFLRAGGIERART